MAAKPRSCSEFEALYSSRTLQQLEGVMKAKSKEEFETHSLEEQVRVALFAFAKGTQMIQHATDAQLVHSAREQALVNVKTADQLRQLVLVTPDKTMEQLLQRRVQTACDLQAHGEHTSCHRPCHDCTQTHAPIIALLCSCMLLQAGCATCR
jgi:hypothetical protein